MKKKVERWYQKDEYLNAFMNLLQETPIDFQCEIALDIIVQATTMIERDYSKVIQNVTDFDPKIFKRWYDKNPHVHLSIELLRDLNGKQREEIIKEYIEKLLEMHKFELEEIETTKDEE